MDETSPKLESILVDWLSNEFGMPAKVHYVTNHGPLIVWKDFIIMILHPSKVESGSWVSPKDLHTVAVGDPEFFEKLKSLVQIRLNELDATYKPLGYAGKIAYGTHS